MTRYVALLRGIGPSNPNMHGAKLKGAFESLGFKNVAPVISSGNVVFDSPSKNTAALEKKIEDALPKKLGFKSTTIIRSQQELEALVKKDPFKGATHSRSTYLNVTFLKDKKAAPGGVVCTMLDTSKKGSPELMLELEKKYSKNITTRTYLTVGRILKKMTETSRTTG